MRIEELKKGQQYNVRLIFQEIDCDNDCVFIDPIGLSKLYLSLSNAADRVTPISTPSEPPTSVGTSPKYDPCRLFRKGDIVRYVPHNGRECPAMPLDEYYLVKTLTVVEDEDANHNVLVETQDGRNKYIRFCYLELVTPAKESEQYKVNHVKELELFEVCHYEMGDDTIEKEGELHKIVRTIYWYGKRKGDRTQEEAKAEAEAERDRLNEEWRKELNNG